MLQSEETDGEWGEWGDVEECPEGQYVYGYALRSEEYYGMSGDDTALNAVKLYCAEQPGAHDDTSTFITSTEGEWGDYSAAWFCNGIENPVTGFVMKSEAPLGYADDTAANKLDFFCRDGERISADTSSDFGDWLSEHYCPEGQAIAGIQTRVQSPQGADVDDTSLNGVRFICRDYHVPGNL